MFGRNWEPASGVVIDKRMGKVKGGGDSAFATMDFIVDVRTAAGDFFRAEVDQPRWSDFWPPKVGQTVKVEVEAKSRKVRFLKDDNTISFAAFQQQQSSSFDAQLAAPAGTPPAGRPAAPAAPVVVPWDRPRSAAGDDRRGHGQRVGGADEPAPRGGRGPPVHGAAERRQRPECPWARRLARAEALDG